MSDYSSDDPTTTKAANTSPNSIPATNALSKDANLEASQGAMGSPPKFPMARSTAERLDQIRQFHDHLSQMYKDQGLERTPSASTESGSLVLSISTPSIEGEHHQHKQHHFHHDLHHKPHVGDEHDLRHKSMGGRRSTMAQEQRSSNASDTLNPMESAEIQFDQNLDSPPNNEGQNLLSVNPESQTQKLPSPPTQKLPSPPTQKLPSPPKKVLPLLQPPNTEGQGSPSQKLPSPNISEKLGSPSPLIRRTLVKAAAGITSNQFSRYGRTNVAKTNASRKKKDESSDDSSDDSSSDDSSSSSSSEECESSDSDCKKMKKKSKKKKKKREMMQLQQMQQMMQMGMGGGMGGSSEAYETYMKEQQAYQNLMYGSQVARNIGIKPMRTAAFVPNNVDLFNCPDNECDSEDEEDELDDGVSFSYKPQAVGRTEMTVTVEPKRQPWLTMMRFGFRPVINCSAPPCYLNSPQTGSNQFSYGGYYPVMYPGQATQATTDQLKKSLAPQGNKPASIEDGKDDVKSTSAGSRQNPRRSTRNTGLSSGGIGSGRRSTFGIPGDQMSKNRRKKKANRKKSLPEKKLPPEIEPHHKVSEESLPPLSSGSGDSVLL